MQSAKERILLTALRLFAKDGYEAVSVSDIASELDMTKGALYKHFKNKRDIFESIVARMEQCDAEQANAHGVPEGPLDTMIDAYRSAKVDQIVAFGKAMFRYWTEDDFASQFRKMLTLEQFRNAEMGALYQQYLASGPLGYMTDLLSGMGVPQPQFEAARFYAPMFFLYSVYDGAEDKASVSALLDDMLDRAQTHLKATPHKKTGAKIEQIM